MSKITFRADDDLVDELEAFDASKSEVMREALREYLEAPSDGADRSRSSDRLTDAESIDDLITDRVDALIEERLDGTFTPSQPQDVNVNISLDGDTTRDAVATGDSSQAREGRPTPRQDGSSAGAGRPRRQAEDAGNTCSQCGHTLTADHVHCPNCGEKATRRVFCDCGDELRSDWAFCPSCGRRTPAADVLDRT